MHGRAKGTADHYWPWAVFFKLLKFRQGSGPKGDNVLWNRGGISVRPWGQGLFKGRRGLGGWLEAWNKRYGAGVGGGAGPSGPRTDVRSDSLGRPDGNSPLCSIGHRPLRVHCLKGRGRRDSCSNMSETS